MFAYIPNLLPKLYNNLLIILKHISKKSPNKYCNLKFLDAGCGIGLTMLLAKNIRFKNMRITDAHGIEIDETLINTSKKLFTSSISKLAPNFKKHNYHIVQNNILNFKYYDKYDIIYFYCPFDDTELETKFENLVKDNMKMNKFIIGSNSTCEDKRFLQLSRYNNVYQKIKT